MQKNFHYSAFETWRINLLRLSFLLLLPAILITRPVLAEHLVAEAFEIAGFAMITAAILGRAWCILYIGGQKNTSVVTSGPYSLCRHPLYLFSIIGVAGFGLILQSLVLTAMLTVVFGTLLAMTARREERRLRQNFGAEYDAYARSTPTILPSLSGFHTDAVITVEITHLRRNFWDATVFVFLFPVAELIEPLQDVSWMPALALF